MTDHQGTRSEIRGQQPAKVGDWQAQRVEERPVEQDFRIPRSRRPIAVENDQTGDERSPSVSSPVTPRGIALSASEKAEEPTNNLDAQFQPVTDPSVPAVIEMVDVALRSHLMTPASEPNLTNP